MNASLSPYVVAHLVTVVPALLIGSIVLLRRKGTRSHRGWGRVWVVLMIATALVSFGIQRSGLSWIHALSVVSLASVSLGLLAARQRDWALHARCMIGGFSGAAVAGVFAMAMPGRFLHSLLLA